MKFSESWLREWLEFDLDTEALVKCLTMAGLEVDGAERAGPKLKRVVVGKILDVAPHPDSERLKICQVDIGKRQKLKVVCGAPNARVGLVAPTALTGAILPLGSKITRSKIRGVESNGMLCSPIELNLGDEAGGLLELDGDAPLGKSVDAYLELDDIVIDIDLTPNRGDCLSVLGVARELVILADGRLRRTHLPGCSNTSKARISISLRDPDSCPRYIGRVIKDVDLQRPTPIQIRERLRRCGIRPISAAVDVTNYVMLEIGQPMHAFDLDRLQDGIIVRRARPKERITLLDGSTPTLNEDTLVIADKKGAVAMAGVMGGIDSAINADTKSIVLEAAHFAPKRVAGRARRHGLHSDSAYRFERGVDPNLPYVACQYATALLNSFTGGRPGPVIDRTQKKYLRKKPAVTVRYSHVHKVLGMPLTHAEITKTLSRISPNRVVTKSDQWRLDPPSYRFDIERECDLVEEIARVHGYDQLPANIPTITASTYTAPENLIRLDRIKGVLVDRDYHEAITYSFVDPEVQANLTGSENPIKLKNPLAPSMSVMRTTLWTGLLEVLRENINRQRRRVRLFEVGKTFHRRKAGVSEVQRIAGVVCGPVAAEQWGETSREVDFFDVKSDLEAIFSLTSDLAKFTFRPTTWTGLHPGQAAQILRGGIPVGRVGLAHPKLQKYLDLSQSVFLFELDLDSINHRRLPKYKKISKFPAIRRDLSVVVNNETPAADVLKIAHDAAGKYLTNLELFDVFRREDIDSKRKSLAFGLTLQASSRTLKDSEVEAIVSRMLDALRDKFNAELRT